MRNAQLRQLDIWHREDCRCRDCTPPHPTPTPPRPLAADRDDPSFAPLCALAGVVAGNAIAFAWHPHAAWAALSAAIGALLGATR